jgi:hypothetical protein
MLRPGPVVVGVPLLRLAPAGKDLWRRRRRLNRRRTAGRSLQVDGRLGEDNRDLCFDAASGSWQSDENRQNDGYLKATATEGYRARMRPTTAPALRLGDARSAADPTGYGTR